ncbi:MAG: RnfABCDGE type electron transport complex subunit G [Lentisphaeria bacterium]|nr:RnfABCDGE type electron transport complex subunit G [Lentisphaeria bacterium]
MKLRNNENVFVLGGFLAVTALISALTLAFVSMITADPIARMREQNTRQSLRQLNLPAFDNAPLQEALVCRSPAGFQVTLMPVKKNGKLEAFAAKTISPNGYAGNIEIMSGFSVNGKILAVLVTSQKETPGLGSNVCERKFQRTIFNFYKPAPKGLPPNPVLDQFNGMQISDGIDWRVKRDGGTFDYVTGATITSRAIVGAVAETGKTLAIQQKKFLQKGKK